MLKVALFLQCLVSGKEGDSQTSRDLGRSQEPRHALEIGRNDHRGEQARLSSQVEQKR